MDFMRSFSGSPFGDYATETLTKFTPIQRHVAQYLVRVYTLLGATIIASAAGAVFHLYTNAGGIMSMVGGLVTLFWLMSTNPQHTAKRTKLLLTFGVLMGISIGPLVEFALEVDQFIVLQALFGAAAVFACFTGAALTSSNRLSMFAVSFISTFFSYLMLFTVFSLFFRTAAYEVFYLYGGLVCFSLYVAVNTQVMIARANAGARDEVGDALTLFMDFFRLFTRILVILLRNRDKKEKSGSARK